MEVLHLDGTKAPKFSISFPQNGINTQTKRRWNRIFRSVQRRQNINFFWAILYLHITQAPADSLRHSIVFSVAACASTCTCTSTCTHVHVPLQVNVWSTHTCTVYIVLIMHVHVHVHACHLHAQRTCTRVCTYIMSKVSTCTSSPAWGISFFSSRREKELSSGVHSTCSCFASPCLYDQVCNCSVWSWCLWWGVPQALSLILS